MLVVLLTAAGAAAAAMLGGLLAAWRRPTTLISSLVLGFAGGIMVGTVTFEIIPSALRLSSLAVVAVGFTAGFVAIYAFDLFVNRGAVAGEEAEQHEEVEKPHHQQPPHGDVATVMAGGMALEAAVEGLSLAVSSTIGAGLSVPLAIAIAIDNLSEGMGISAVDANGSKRTSPGRMMRLTGMIAVATVAATVGGWLLMRGLSPMIHAFVFVIGGGAILYLTVTEVVPGAEAQHFQQSSALATAVGFLVILILSELA